MNKKKKPAGKVNKQEAFQCKMYLGTEFYNQLNEDGRKLFVSTPEGYCTDFTAIIGEGITLGNCVMSFCEVAYIGLNPKYQVGENSIVKSELYKTGKDDTTFSILVTIEEKDDKEPQHELLLFAQRELTDNSYSFALVGDQTMFAM